MPASSLFNENLQLNKLFPAEPFPLLLGIPSWNLQTLPALRRTLTSRDEAHTIAVLCLNPRGTKPFYNTSAGCEGSCNVTAALFIFQENTHDGR